MDEKVIQHSSLKQIIDRMFPEKLNSQMLSTTIQSLKRQRKVSLREIADLILFIADTSHRDWNLELILKTLNDTLDNINWRDVYEKFFESDLKIWNKEYLYTLVDCWLIISGIITVPYEIFFRRWINRENQIEFFKILLDCDEKRTQVYSNIFFEKLVTKEDLKNKCKRNVEYESNLNSVELFQSFKDIDAVEIIDMIKETSPEYCALGLATVQPFCEQVFDALLIQFADGITSQFVYYVLFSRHLNATLSSFKRSYEKISLTRILDIILEHKMLPVIVEVPAPEDMCYDVIILSSRRDHLNLEIWLTNYLKKNSSLFINYLSGKLLTTPKKESGGIDGLTGISTFKEESEIFPFNRLIINSIIKILESSFATISNDSLNVIREIKSKMIANKGLEKPAYSDKATVFISEVINSQIEVEDAIQRLRDLLKGDTVVFVKRVFSLLIDNYSSLYKMPNSDMLAVFFGELIRKKIMLSPFLKVSLQLIKNSLKHPENDREYAFAFRILEIFFTEIPEFFFEIEDIESVRYGLIKKELIIVDDDAQREIELEELLNIIFNIEDDKTDFDQKFNVESAMASLCLEGILPNPLGNKATNGQICRYFYRNLNESTIDQFYKYCRNQPNSFVGIVAQKGFSLIKLMFTYKTQNELQYCGLIGTFLGKILIGRNKPVNLDVFDFKSFLLKSIEYRRIAVSVAFVVNFLKEGRNGIIFVPYNPWLMSILDLLLELYPCTLAKVREKIAYLYTHFNMKITHRSTLRMKEHLVKYIIEYDGALRQVIAAALDFSVREICNKIVKSCFGVAKSTATALFSKIRGENRFFLFRNLLINLTKALIHISAQEPLKASICGNITHFLKLSMNDLSLENVYNIVSQNLLVCCSVIEKAGITQVNEVVATIYNDLISKEDSSVLQPIPGPDAKILLRIVSESCFVEKVNIRSIENVEYQEIRSFLIHLGKKMPTKRKDYISEEWHTLLGQHKTVNFKRIMSVITNSPDKDEMCLSLCKYLVGHALKTNCTEEYIFKFITSIFDVSAKCKKEVVGWLIYSEDSKKFNILLIKKFVEYDFICLEEYDQSLSKLLKVDDHKFLAFVLDLLDTLILSKIKLCTVYDFIYTIESLNRVNDNTRVFEFFKKIEAGMMKFHDSGAEFSVFDEFLKELNRNIPPEQYLACFRENYRMEKQNFKLAFKSCWHHFVLYSGSFRYFKIDILAILVRDDLFNNLKESLKYFVQAYSKQHYLFFLFYCRFIVKTLDFVEENIENRIMIWKILELLSPTNVPGFTAQFIEIMNHTFVTKYFERNEAYWIAKELLKAVKFNQRLEPLVFAFFSRHILYFSRFSLYLSYYCPFECINLKNLFNQVRPKTAEKASNTFFNTFYNLTMHTKTMTAYSDIIENLAENGPITSFAIENLKNMIERNVYTREIILLLLIRSSGKNVPAGIKSACNELFKRNDIKEIVADYETRFFNKI
ncbi:hypothetical protein GINT2_000505 [Glugoides intestinalis]